MGKLRRTRRQLPLAVRTPQPAGGCFIEPLEPRALLAVNLRVNSVVAVDVNNVPTPNPTIGTRVYMRVNYAVTEVPAGGSYTISQTLYGVTFSHVTSFGAGSAGTTNWNHVWGGWIVNHSGPATATLTLDSANVLAESNEADNGGTASINPVQLPLPAKFAQPMGAVAFRDYGYANYVDQTPGSPGFADYRGGPLVYDGHDAIDMTFPTFRSMDDGVPVYAAAAGTVAVVADGNFDRNTATTGGAANFVTIDYGNGWLGDYYHLREGSVGVAVGQHVVAGQVIGIVGSSGNSSAPHLHFSAYNGEAVETYRDPNTFWQDPLPYQGDVDEVVDSGITTYNPTSYLNVSERPPETRTLRQQSGLVVYEWAVSFTPPNDPYTITFYRPNGAVYFTSPFSYPTANRGGHSYAFTTLPTVPDLGTWKAIVSLNGVPLRTDTFTVTAAGAPVARVAAGSTFIADGRTTAMTAATVAQGASAAALSFTLTNLGTAALTPGALNVPPGWKVVDALAASIGPGAADTFSLAPDTSMPGYRLGSVTFTTNDANAPIYDFAVAATVTPTGALPAVSLYFRDAVASEAGLDPAVFRVTRTGPTTSALTVDLSRAGSATAGSDYVAFPLSVVIPAGQSSASVILTPIDDGSAEVGETVVLSLAASTAYVPGPNAGATATLADNDTAGGGSLSGTLYLDRNFNTHRDASEATQAGISLFLDYNADGLRQPSEPAATADAAGRYTFPALSAGRYAIRLVDSPDYIPSTPVGSWALADGEARDGIDLGAFPITFRGTTGDDHFSLAAAGAPNRLSITVNSVTYSGLASQLPSLTLLGLNGADSFTLGRLDGVASTLPAILLDGGVGADTLIALGSAAVDSATFSAASVALAGVSAGHAGMERVLFDGAGGADQLSVASGVGVGLRSTGAFQSIAIAAGGYLDAADNDVLLVGAQGASLLAARAFVADGRIRTSLTQPQPGRFATLAVLDNHLLRLTQWNGLPLGVAGNFGQVVIKYAWAGDNNIDDHVSADDYRNVVANMGRTDSQWLLGDLNGDGRVSLDDFAAVTANLGAGADGGPMLLKPATEATAVPTAIVASASTAKRAAATPSTNRPRPKRQKAKTTARSRTPATPPTLRRRPIGF